MFLIAGNYQFCLTGDCRSQDRIIFWIRGDIYNRKFCDDKRARGNILRNRICFIGIKKPA